MPANATPTLRSGRIAAAAIPAYAPVKADGNLAAAGEAIIGIAEAAAASGKRLSVVVDGSAEAWRARRSTTAPCCRSALTVPWCPSRQAPASAAR